MKGETERAAQEAVTTALVGTRFSSIEWVKETGSTNDDLVAKAKGGASECVLVTDLQTTGRGRRNRVWDAPARSSVLLSVLLRDRLFDNPFWTVGAVSLAAAEAAGARTTTHPSLKWPNDVLVGDAKLAGVLGQIVEGGVIVGIGINVNWDAVTVARFEGRATAINQHLPAADGASGERAVVDRAEFAIDLLRGLESLLDLDADAVRARWTQRCATLGRSVRVVRGDGDVLGEAVGVRSDGALLVESSGHVTPHLVGDVTHLRAT